MSTNKKYDIIIAGAGPAGSTAGYMLGKAGLDVLLIDKSFFPRQKLCGGCITHKTVKLLERVFDETPGSLKKENIITSESGSYELRTKKGLISRGESPFPFRFVERDRYDHYLLRKAREAGAAVIEGEAVTSLDKTRNTLYTSGGKSFRADIFIGADGVNSGIRRSAGPELSDTHGWQSNTAAAFEVIIDKKRSEKRFEHPVLFYGFIDWGYAWIFPVNDRLKIGMCGLKHKNSKRVISLFRDFLSEAGVQDIEREKIRGYVLPYGNFLSSPVYGNILLAGDAAGLADPFMGEGIFFAQRSAELAAEAIIGSAGKNGAGSGRIGRDYAWSFKEHIYPEMVYAGRIQRSIFTWWNRLDFLPLKLFMHIFGNMMAETVHGARSYKWMSRL